ncbi:MAG: divalent cation tolerance protein CutA [Candidatus Lokiarchaeota archaeon]|nr:divalent cation tolerance protein CutA [Candidatus Lokiarchaeota archaeon]MBD3200008.1 divalent cation tolerance protein CutA [Candidatus Lokiarchaeota archaeon]
MTKLLFLVTAPNRDEALKIANYLVEKRIASCVNIINPIQSIYRWKGNIENEEEILLLIKTTDQKSEILMKSINNLHSYETPECIGFKIEKGLPEYLKWIENSVN